MYTLFALQCFSPHAFNVYMGWIEGFFVLRQNVYRSAHFGPGRVEIMHVAEWTVPCNSTLL